MSKEAIILAGGLGTRLKTIIDDIPKPMAIINNEPLKYLFDYLIKYNIRKFILSVGYKSKSIIEYFGNDYRNCKIVYVVEPEPLGTGGALLYSLQSARNISENEIFVLNGDSFFNVDLTELFYFHKKSSGDITLALKPMKEFDRYGMIRIGQKNRIIEFVEKKYQKTGLINGGVYVINKDIFKPPLLSSFIGEGKKAWSFEKDFLEKCTHHIKIYGYISDTYFIDIGVPDDYAKAQREMALGDIPRMSQCKMRNVN